MLTRGCDFGPLAIQLSQLEPVLLCDRLNFRQHFCTSPHFVLRNSFCCLFLQLLQLVKRQLP